MSKDNVCKTPRWRLLQQQLNNLTPQEFVEKMNNNTLIIDVRTKTEFDAGYIKGAFLIDYFEDDFWEKISSLDKDKDFLIYCRSGRRSIRVCTLMKNGGFDSSRVFNLKGGLLSWLEVYPNSLVTASE